MAPVFYMLCEKLIGLLVEPLRSTKGFLTVFSILDIIRDVRIHKCRIRSLRYALLRSAGISLINAIVKKLLMVEEFA